MTWAQLVIEMKARGFTHMGSRVEQYLQDAYLIDICEEEDWPFLDATKEGTAPLEISDLRTVRFVLNITQNTKLTPLLEDRITDDLDPDLSTPGTGFLYYLSSEDTLSVYPANTTDTLRVHYWKVPEELSGVAEPLMPKRWHSLIIDGAVARAYQNSDDWELSVAARNTFNDRLQAMKDSLLNQQHDAPDDYLVITDPAALR